MSHPLHAYDRLREAQFTDEQARAILEAMSGGLVTRDYLDARLERLQRELFLSLAGIVTFLVGLATGVLLFALPKLV